MGDNKTTDATSAPMQKHKKEVSTVKPSCKMKTKGGCKLSTPIIAGVAGLASLIIGLLLGYFVLAGFGGNLNGKTSLSQAELDTVVATYNYNGKHNVTAREVLESQGSLDQAKQKDNTYKMPSADAILGYTRNQILVQAANKLGIKVDDKEIDEYVKKKFGGSSLKELAKQANLSEDVAKKMIQNSVLTEKLVNQETKGKGISNVTMPDQPEKPKDADKNKATAAYADYIKKVVGDAWDSQNNKWANDNSEFAHAFTGDNKFNGKTATYQQATMAYYTVSTHFQQAQQEATKAATDYMNKLFSSASLTLKTLAS